MSKRLATHLACLTAVGWLMASAVNAQEGETPEWSVKWSNGHKMDKSDKSFKLKFGGRIQADYIFARTRVELEFAQSMMNLLDPLVFKCVQGSKAIDSGRVGGEAEFWPLVCEDIQASVPEGRKPGREKRQRLEQCIRWEGLWSSGSPSRQDVLDAMADFDFRPIPKGS